MFPPYHNLANCPRLRRALDDTGQHGGIPPAILADHQRYHYSLIHKLRSARHYVDRLAITLTTTSPQDIVSDSEAFIFEANRLIDGFFYCGGSGLDILAREVLTYAGIPLPQNVYFQTARDLISQARPGDPLLLRLAEPPWKQEFSEYRNALTHELLLAGTYSINVKIVGGNEEREIVIPLPDDPRMQPDQRTYIRNPNVLDYCTISLRRLLSLVNQVYGDIAARLLQNGALPV